MLANFEEVSFTFNLDDSIPKDVEFSSIVGMNIYRIIQEATNNAFKYANANNVSVSILDMNTALEVQIVDDGQGFDEHVIDEGNGLNNMHKRAKDIGGDIKVESDLNKGTRILLSLKY